MRLRVFPDRTREGGFSFMEVLISMGILVTGSVLVLGLFTIGVNRMVKRKVDARLIKVRPEIDSILQSEVDSTAVGKSPQNIPRENPIPLSRRGYAVAVTWKKNPWDGPQFWGQVELLFQGKPVRLLSVPITRSFLDPKALEAPVGPGN